MNRPLIEARQLGHRYEDGTVALRGLSFGIGPGEAVAIVGANGAGKSTLVQHLIGHLRPTEGQLRVDGEPVCDRTLAAVRRRVGLVFQDPDDQLFMPTVLDDVAFGPRNLQLPQAEVEQRVREALEAVDLWAQRAKAPFRLSGGERKRAAIAGVLAMAPDVMVLDEPTSGLDPHARHQVMTLVAGFPHTRIVASHDLELVRALCPRTLVLHEGALVADGATARILEDRALLTRCRLGHPPGMAVCRTGGPGAVGGTASTP